MSLNLRGVHVYEKVPGKAEFRLKETHPAIRVAREEQVLFLQDGAVYDPSGKPVELKDLPGWFKEEMQKMNPVALREAGFRLAEPKKQESKPE